MLLAPSARRVAGVLILQLSFALSLTLHAPSFSQGWVPSQPPCTMTPSRRLTHGILPNPFLNRGATSACSGTLAPIHSFASELATPFHATLQTGHCIDVETQVPSRHRGTQSLHSSWLDTHWQGRRRLLTGLVPLLNGRHSCVWSAMGQPQNLGPSQRI